MHSTTGESKHRKSQTNAGNWCSVLSEQTFPFSQSRSLSKSGDAATVVVAQRSSVESVRDKESFVGIMRRSSILPQYLITAMFTGARHVHKKWLAIVLCEKNPSCFCQWTPVGRTVNVHSANRRSRSTKRTSAYSTTAQPHSAHWVGRVKARVAERSKFVWKESIHNINNQNTNITLYSRWFTKPHTYLENAQ